MGMNERVQGLGGIGLVGHKVCECIGQYEDAHRMLETIYVPSVCMY